MKKLLLTAILLISFSGITQAQDYKTGIGLRGGFPSGLTLKHFIKDDAALELILGRSWGYRGFLITGLYEKHKQAFGVEGLYWFYGAGMHVGFYNYFHYYNKRNKFYYGYENRTQVVIGIDGILGIEYLIKEIPFTVGLDIKPSFDIVPFGYGDFDGAFSLRYVF